VALPLRSLTPAPPDPILGLTETFRADTRPDKVNLSVGVYVDDTGVTPVIPCVLERSAACSRRRLEGLPADRRRPATRRRSEISSSARTRDRGERPIATARRPAGPAPCVWPPTSCSRRDPRSRSGSASRPGRTIPALLAGRIRAACLPYLDESGRSVDVAGCSAAPVGNPGDVSCSTARATTRAAWTRTRKLGAIAEIVIERELMPVVDFAYQGFGFGLRETPIGWRPGRPASSSSSARASPRTSPCTTNAWAR